MTRQPDHRAWSVVLGASFSGCYQRTMSTLFPGFDPHSDRSRFAAWKSKFMATMRSLVFVAFPWSAMPDCAAQTETRPAAGKSSPAGENARASGVDSPTAKGDRLRRPGFLFLELDCYDLARAIGFFRDVAGFEINRNDGDFAILRSARGELLLNRRGQAPKRDAPDGQPVPKFQGPRVEIGIVVEDLDKAFAAAQKHPGWTIADRIARQPWGVRDFRVWSPERYYLRITEGPG